LIIKDAGKALVQVVDNGLGMSVTDARLSLNVMLHQKSVRRKIYFLCIPKVSGEASIAAIAHVEMKTKQDQEELGTKIVVEGSVCVTRGSRAKRNLICG
jgi:DNA mismatch repair protein MutL